MAAETQRADRARTAWSVAETAVVVAAVGVGSIGLVGLVLGMLGRYTPAPPLVLGAVAVAGTARPVWRAVDRSVARPRMAPLVLALVVAAAATMFWAATPSKHVLVDRDPASYNDTAVYLADTGGLRVDQSDTPFADLEVRHEGATFSTGPGRYEFQFNHLLSAVLAPAYQIGGRGLMFRVPALLGGLGLVAVYLFAVRATRRPWWSVLVPVILGASAPFMYVYRDSFSESVVLVLLWSGLLAAVVAVERRSVAMAVLAGWLLGATTATRVDALVFILPLVLLTAAWIAVASEGERRRRTMLAAAALAGSVLPIAVGWVDLNHFSGIYPDVIRRQLRLLYGGVALAALAAAVLVTVGSRPGLAEAVRRHRRRSALAVGLGLSAVLGALWVIRPAVQVTRGPLQEMYRRLQAADGVLIDGTRAYHELSMTWMTWYFGALLVGLAIVGFGLVGYRAVLGRSGLAELLTAAVGGVVGLLYWWDPSIYADQLWATRRFVPVVFPASVVLAVLVLSRVPDRLARAGVPGGRVVGAAFSVLLVVSAAAPTWPIRWGRTQDDYLVAVDSLCRHLGADAAVVTIGKPTLPLAPAVRSWCGVPVALPSGAGMAELGAQAAAWRERGVTLWAVSADGSTLARDVGATTAVWHSRRAQSEHQVAATLTRPPDGYAPARSLQLSAVRVPG